MDKAEKTILATTKELLKLLGIEDAKVKAEKVEEDEEGQEGEGRVWEVQIETERAGILIGFHGETIAALQLMVGLIVYKNLGKWQSILLNVGDYREKRKAQLERMALNAAQRVKFSGQAVALPFLNAAERRVIHLFLKEDGEVETESEGEERERRLVIRQKKVEK